MTRRFREHDLRPTHDLGGIWDFAFLGDVEPDEAGVGGIRFDDHMAVPGSFDATPRYAGKRGLTAYRRRFLLSRPGRTRLVLDGVHHWCRVFLDGEALGEHIGGFTRFHFDAPRVEAGEHEVLVLVDNRFNYKRCPLHLLHMDWHHYGGVARGAEVHSLPHVWLDAIEADTLDWRARRVRLRIRIGAESAGEAELAVRIGERELLRERVTISKGASTIERNFEAPELDAWTTGEPHLHEVHATLGGDDLRTRIGIRQVRVDGQRILLNDEPVRLLGFNRHESHPQMGHGLPEQQIVADLQLLRDMGSNFVRGSHYPQDSRFLDLCDELGMLVWSEATGWQHGVEHLTDPHFIAAQWNNIDEMVRMSRNHPSVIIWGILNESLSNEPKCKPAYAKLLGRLRELDPTRPVTYATHLADTDVCLDLVDIVSVNTYPGWYRTSIESIPGELDEIFGNLDKAGHANKPFILSEIGADAVPGCRDWDADRWSEDYQARLLETTLRHVFQTRNRICGIAIWMLSDTRASEAVTPMMRRPRAFNNKGVTDEYRRPKRSFETVKRMFGEIGGNAKPKS